MPTTEELSNEIKELRCRIDYTQIKLNGFMKHVENSMKQANDNYQNWQDRHDVEKAFKDYLGQGQNPGVFIENDMKAFAVFFAERIKGAPINTVSKNCACQSCKTKELITENHCNVCGAKQD